jgi:chromosome partitioning protein
MNLLQGIYYVEVITVINQKGGVGKTTIVSNLGAALAEKKRRVLAIDLDPQGTLTSCTLPSHNGPGTAELLGYTASNDPDEEPIAARSIPVFSHEYGMDVTRSHDLHMFLIEERLRASHMGLTNLSIRLEDIEDQYDYVLIDSPPNFGVLTINGIYAADWILVAMQPTKEALESLKLLKKTIKDAKKQKPSLQVIGSTVSLYNKQTNIAQSALECLEEDNYFPFVKTLRYSTAFQTAFAMQRPMITHEPKHPGTDDVRDLASAVIDATNSQPIETITQTIIPPKTAEIRAELEIAI